MDLSQALLCLVTFSTPAPQPTGAVTCPVVQESAEVQKDKAKFDLDFHSRKEGQSNGPMVADAAEPTFLE